MPSKEGDIDKQLRDEFDTPSDVKYSVPKGFNQKKSDSALLDEFQNSYRVPDGFNEAKANAAFVDDAFNKHEEQIKPYSVTKGQAKTPKQTPTELHLPPVPTHTVQRSQSANLPTRQQKQVPPPQRRPSTSTKTTLRKAQLQRRKDLAARQQKELSAMIKHAEGIARQAIKLIKQGNNKVDAVEQKSRDLEQQTNRMMDALTGDSYSRRTKPGRRS